MKRVNPIEHDPLVCGPDRPGERPLCPGCAALADAGLLPSVEADVLERWPQLAKPGPQTSNQIAGDFGGQLRSIYGHAGAPVWTGLSALCPPIDPPAPEPMAAEMVLSFLMALDTQPEALNALRRLIEGGAA